MAVQHLSVNSTQAPRQKSIKCSSPRFVQVHAFLKSTLRSSPRFAFAFAFVLCLCWRLICRQKGTKNTLWVGVHRNAKLVMCRWAGWTALVDAGSSSKPTAPRASTLTSSVTATATTTTAMATTQHRCRVVDVHVACVHVAVPAPVLPLGDQNEPLLWGSIVRETDGSSPGRGFQAKSIWDCCW